MDCNTKLTDNLSTDLLLQRLGIYGIEECLCLRRLRWYGHVRRASCCINHVSNLVIPVRVNGEDQGKLGLHLVLPTPDVGLSLIHI